MSSFSLKSKNSPSRQQEDAINKLVAGLNDNVKNQVLLGITGSGKTFTMANVIKRTNKPTIVLSHNKTLAGQLYTEFKELFPNNNVEYFISYFDYYRPEAYLPSTDTYIDKTSKTNMDIEAMRLSSLNSLLTKRDTIVVASVAAIYGALNPNEYSNMFIELKVNQKISRKELIYQLIKRDYLRNDVNLESAHFRVRGDIIDVFPSWTDKFILRIELFGDVIESISQLDPFTNDKLKDIDDFLLMPGSGYVTKEGTMKKAIELIKAEIEERLKYFKSNGKLLEAQRLEDRVNHDIEALEEFGFVGGIENYSRYLDGRDEGERPYTIFDYLPSDGIIIVDESHMMIPQIKGMYAGDRSRKETLVNYGFRLPSALDNRPLKLDEYEGFSQQRIFVSATPSDYEIDKTNGVVTEILIRPTGLLDPTIEVVSTNNQIEDIVDRVKNAINMKQRVFVLTITIRMAEELTRYLQEKSIKVAYIHNELKAFERNEILRKLRMGVYDVVIGINLLREGIDVPEVALILVLDADKESFFRSKTSLIQISGRAARNENGLVIFYADKMTKSMEEAIAITQYRRKIQKEYNKKHNIIPQTIKKDIPEPIYSDIISKTKISTLSKTQKKEYINDLRKAMLDASKKLDFERAAQIRDLILEYELE